MISFAMKNELSRTFLREWRKHRNLSLEEVSSRLGMSHGNLSLIERGESPYNQRLLDNLAIIYDCELIELLIRDPSDRNPIWKIWKIAGAREKRQIVDLAEALLKTGAEN